MKVLFSDLDDLIARSLDLIQKRQAYLAANVANADTPGYKAKDLSFDRLLREALEPAEIEVERTNPLHMSDMEAEEPRVVNSGGVPGVDGNDVALDKEMVKANANALRFRAVAEAASRRLRLLRLAVTEGGR